MRVRDRSWRLRSLAAAAMAIALAGPCAARGQTVRLQSDSNDQNWGARQSSTRFGKILWYTHNGGTNKDDVVFYDGSTANSLQPQGGLTGVGNILFALGSGAAPGHVIAAWRRETDFAWLSVDGGTPFLVNAVNPSNAAAPLNPEGGALADGCVFLILQDATGATPHKLVYSVDPVTGNGTILTDPASYPIAGTGIGASRITSSGCKAAWPWDDGSGTLRLHFYDGSSIHVVDSGDIGLPDMAQGRVVYTRTVASVSQVFVYDSTAASPAPAALTSYSDATKVNSRAKTDGRHVAWVRQNTDNSNTQIVLNGGLQLTDSSDKPAEGAIFVDFPVQLQRGQMLWTGATGALRYAANGAIQTVPIAPATTVVDPWLADGSVAFLGLANDAGTDLEPFLFTGSPPADPQQPSPPMFLFAAHGNAQATLSWDKVLGATSYSLYYATVSGVTKDNYAGLPGGTKVAGVTPPFTAAGLTNGTAYYFVVTTVDSGGEGPDSPEASATPKAPYCVSSSGGACLTTIQGAIAAASSGDTIRVAQGTYSESGHAGANFYLDRSITLEGGWNSAFTARDPGTYVTTLLPKTSSLSVLDIEGQFGNEDAVAPTVDGFLITGGRGDLGGSHGGGVRIRDSNAVVRSCIVTTNKSYLLGGGFWIQRGGPTLESNQILNNSVDPAGQAGSGGGIELEDTRATLIGNTISGNLTLGTSGFGGGVSIDGGGLVTLTNNTITSNAAASQLGAMSDHSYGGGVSVNNATVFLTGNEINANSGNSAAPAVNSYAAGSGGGVSIRNSTSFLLSANTVNNNTGGFSINIASLSPEGGGIFIESSQGSLLGNTISGNRTDVYSYGFGGGLTARTSAVTIRGGEISNNANPSNTISGGGGVFASASAVAIDGVRIRGNSAGSSSFGLGGAVDVFGSPITITNTVMSGNLGKVGGFFADSSSAATIVNDTIADNAGTGLEFGGIVTVANCVVLGHVTGVKADAGATPTVRYNVFYNNATINTGFSLDTTNVVINPQVDASYAPMRGSPCIDSGDNAYVPAGVTADIAGNLRFLDDPTKPDTGVGTPPIVDIGAYELPPGFGFYTLTPCRVLDTRNAVGPQGGPALSAGTERSFPFAGQCGIPVTAKAVSINVAVTQPTTGPGFLTLYPGGTTRPVVATINYNSGQTRANNAVTPLGAAGDIAVHCGQGSGTVQLIVDVNGYFQ